MSYRITQLSPQTSTRGSSIRVLVNHEDNTRPEGLGNMQFLRSWFEYDFHASRSKRGQRLNWNAVWGLAIMVGISGGFWGGLALVVSRMAR